MDEDRSILKRGTKRTLWLRAGYGSQTEVVVKRFHAPGIFDRWRDPGRAEAELRALRNLLAHGLPVPEPLSVERHPKGVDLVMRSIEGARPLGQIAREHDPVVSAGAASSSRVGRIARELGELLARAALCGLRHPDLHAGNVLVDADGRAWLVDLRGARVGGEFSWRDHVSALVVLAADLRERTSARTRARVLVACHRALERAGRDDLPEIRSVAHAVDAAARTRRRTVVARSSRRWTRTSSVAVPIERATAAGITSASINERGFRTRDTNEAACWRALDASSELERAGLSVAGGARAVRSAWRTAARLHEHGIPSPVPLAIVLTPGARAVFGPAPMCAGTLRGLREVELDTQTRARAAESLGRLHGILFDRALALFGTTESSVRFDALGNAGVAVGARLRAVDPLEPVAAISRALDLAPRASRIERARFVVGWLRAQQMPAQDLARLRAQLCGRSTQVGNGLGEPSQAPIVGVPTTGARHGSLVRREKLRRRVRARVLACLTQAAGVIPPSLFRGALTALAPLGAWTKFERVTRANLELALGNTTSSAERARIASAVRRHCARQFAEWVRLARGAPPDSAAGRWIEDLVELDASVEILERELRRGRGALVVTAHIGNWELLAARLRRAGHRGAVVGLARPKDSSSRWLEDLRRGYGVQTIAQSGNPRAILRALDEGLVVGLLSDLEVRRLDGEFLPFFGHPALTMTAPAALARAAGAPLLPARCVLDPTTGRYRLVFETPLAPDPDLDRRARTTELTARLNAVFERWIRAAPEQWAWHQPRWRTRPGAVPVAAAKRPWRSPAEFSLQSPDQGLAGD